MAGRQQPAGDRKRTSVSIDVELVERLRKEADARLIGPGLLAEHLIRNGLDRLAPAESLLRSSEPQQGEATFGDAPASDEPTTT
jgi:hypothetical protein